MRIQLMSDLHLEHLEDRGRAFLESLEPEGVDILVLAGDISTRSRIAEVLKWFCAEYRAVVFVPGNHEYYGSITTEFDELLAQVRDSLDNLYVLDNIAADVLGVRFVGGTLWFPEFDRIQLSAERRMMNDFRLIQYFEPWVYEKHAATLSVLADHAASSDVVVTHHIPADACIPGPFIGSRSNHFFCHDLSDLIRKAQPSFWFYGHTHFCQEQQIGRTRLICNPRGYAFQDFNRGSFDPRKILSLRV